MARQSQEVKLILSNNCNNKNFVFFDSQSSSPLDNWKKSVPRGTHIKLVNDEFLSSRVLELFAPSTSLQNTCFIQSPETGSKFGVEAESSFLVFVLRNFGRAFLIDIIVQDTYNSNYRIRTDTSIGHPVLKSFSCLLPLKLESGWNHLPLDLRELSSKIFNINYKRTMKIRIHANCLLFKIYFTKDKPTSDKIYLK